MPVSDRTKLLLTLLFTLGGVGLLGLAAANLVLWSTLVEVYAELNRVRRDPFERARYAEAEVPEKGSRPRVVLFGDSRMDDWRPPPSFSGVEVVNLGIGGQTSAQVLGRLEADVLPMKPDLVVIQVCMNDLKVMGRFEPERAAIVDTCVENVARMVERLEAAGVKAIVTTVFPVGPVDLKKRLTIWSGSVLDAVREANERLRRLRRPNLTLVDCDPLFSSSGRMRSPFAKDTYHLTEAGYRALGDYLAPKIYELVGG